MATQATSIPEEARLRREAQVPVRLGVIGLGRGFLLTLPTLREHPEVSLAAAMDPRGEARAAFSSEFEAPCYRTLEALLGDPNVDAVYIASPQGNHAEHSIAAARAGKHVLVEKPMAPTAAECEAMIEAAASAGIVLVVGPSHVFDASVQRAAQIIGSGVVGSVRAITALNYTDFMYRYRRPEELDNAQGGGVLYAQGSHQIDIVRQLAGDKVASVRAITGQWDATRPGTGAYSAFLTFSKGSVATLSYSGYAHFDSDELMGWISELGYDKESHSQSRARLATLGGTAEAEAKRMQAYGNAIPSNTRAPHHEHFGFVLASCERADLRLMPDGVWIYTDVEQRYEQLAPPRVPRALVIEEFIGALQGEGPPIHDGRWGQATIACCEAIQRSSAESREIILR